MSDVYFYAHKSFGASDAVQAEELGCLLLHPMETVSTPYVFVAPSELENGNFRVCTAVSSARSLVEYVSKSLDECIGYAKHLSSVTAQPA